MPGYCLEFAQGGAGDGGVGESDMPEVVERTLDVMARRVYEEYELLAANTPAQVIVYWDDVTTAYLSPRLFRRFVRPVYRTIADLVAAETSWQLACARRQLEVSRRFLGG